MESVDVKIHSVHYNDLSFFPKLIRDYLASSAPLRPFIKYPFDFEAFGQVISDKKFTEDSRQTLVSTLKEQYASVKTTSAVQNNIEKLLKAGTFTVTTAHQPALFTGPLYVIYKILSAINLAQRLCREFPGNHFVPVYFMGAEDHDFAEINHTWLSGDKIEWQQRKKGAVGRLSVENILPLVDDAATRLHGRPFTEEITSLLKEAYHEHSTLSGATLHFVNQLFGKYGLLVLIPDNKTFKKVFAPIVKKELTENHSFHLSEQTNQKLQTLGYDLQVTPREVNLFYLDENLRERIILNQHSGKYEVLNTQLSFGRDEILQLADDYPERFSPNVMLRPLYQETLLPNLAYIGGAGELSYWLQQKKIFDHYAVNFPMLVLRNSALFIDSAASKKIAKAGLEWLELFDNEESLIQNFVRKKSNGLFDFTAEKQKAEEVFSHLKDKAVAVDPTLAGAVEAQRAAFLKSLEGIETKIMRAEKRNAETTLNQIKSVKAKLFPDNNLQERVENFLPLYAQYGPSYIDNLMKEFDPFRKEFLILTEAF